MKLRHNYKILRVKEEGEKSHVNKPRDKHVTKRGKANNRDWLSMMCRPTEVTKGVIDQQDLLQSELCTFSDCNLKLGITIFMTET